MLKITGVEPLKKIWRSQRLRWFGHVEKKSKKRAPAMAIKIIIKGKERKT